MKGKRLLTVVLLSILAVTGILAGGSVFVQTDSSRTTADGTAPVPHPRPWS